MLVAFEQWPEGTPSPIVPVSCFLAFEFRPQLAAICWPIWLGGGHEQAAKMLWYWWQAAGRSWLSMIFIRCQPELSVFTQASPGERQSLPMNGISSRGRL